MSTLALNQIQKAKETHATFLDLGNCDLTELPDELIELPWLVRLNLGDFYYDRDQSSWIKAANKGNTNQLGTNSLGVLAKLPQLQSLYLRNTGISDIGVLAKLPQLQTLHLSSTGISDISPLRSLIQSGVDVKWSDSTYEGPGIYVKDCPLVTPPVEIVQQGNAAILSFFRQIDEQGGTIPLYEAKLIMVGEPGAGKTSLTEKLIDESHPVLVDDPKKKSTLGINVRENWQFADPKRTNELFTSHIWDFGGQEIQYMTHQFFLTPESLYVLVADDRKQHTLFPYWFEVIQLLGKDETGNNSPVLVVLNERSHKSITNFDLNDYRRKYPDIQIDMLEVDLAETDLGRFKMVRDRIQQLLCSLSHVGRQLPKKWPDIRKAILAVNDTKNHISEQEFAKICARFNVTRTEDQQLISKYLHQLGVILHFQNDRQLRDFIIINPSWALKAVYAVLEDTDVKKRNGLFTETDLDRYWEMLTAEERIKILSLMKQDNFEICYPVGNHAYIAPQLLSDIRPEFEWNNKDSLKCHFFYRFMPKGIMTRLIVRKHDDRKNDELVWSRGAVFHRNECDILVTENETERNGLIAIEVLGPPGNRIRALDFIRDEIEDIHRKWFPNIEYEERAPCNCNDCKDSATPTFFSWKSLSQRVEENRKTIECDKGKIKDVPVIPLLEGVYDRGRIESIQRARRWQDVEIQGAFPFTDSAERRSVRPKTNTISPVYEPLAIKPEKVEKSGVEETPSKEKPSDMKNTETGSWRVVAIAATVAAVFFAFAKSNSEFDFLGLFHAKQGSETANPIPPAVTKSEAPATATVIGSVKVNGRNVSAEDVKQVYIKGATAGPRATLDNDRFKLSRVKIPVDRLVSIAIDLKDGRSTSELFDLPEPNENSVIDVGEVLLDVKPAPTTRPRGGSPIRPTIIINNQNIQKSN